MNNDRNFDDLAERFKRKVYGGLKGDIRLAVLWRDLEEQIPQIHESKPLRVLDIGAGLSQLAIRLAKLGHQVTVNDISSEMLSIARESAEQSGVIDSMVWHHCPFQELSNKVEGKFDVVLCHAVVEWLADPEPLLVQLKQFLSEEGVLSFTYYNRHSLEYRNLIRGNFNLLKRDTFTPDPGSLTPSNPLLPEQVQEWVDDAALTVQATSGVRVFHDYVTTLRGGNGVPESVVEMELVYSQREPYMWLGRYIHLLLTNNSQA
ncbi:MAG: methyltransferase domain-containing protein [Porticoccus sp.]